MRGDLEELVLLPISLKNYFKNVLVEFYFPNIPDDLRMKKVKNFFYHKRPVKNGVFLR